ncbi:cell division topological specificity factor [Azospirillum fermentarium]|nr:cell division topological specificity factor MinE [Azospirillum fermentarium]MCW2245757.1 cell division topological specificity factor [Azospirillum fermentarium]
MSIFSFFRSTPKPSAVQAKERLQIVMAHERVGRTGPDYLPVLQQELLSVIAKYIDIDQNKVEVKLDRGGDCSTLEVNIELPIPESGSKDAKPSVLKASVSRPAATPRKDVDPEKASALVNGGLKKRS